MKATLHIIDASGANAVAAEAPGAHTMTADEMDVTMARSIKAFPAKTAGLGGQPLAPTVLANGTKQFELTATVVKWEVEPGKLVDAWTYNGTVPGPTIHVNPGDKIRLVLHNQLPESTAIHFHGLITPNSMDGVPEITQPPVKSGQTFTYSFTAQSTPAVGMCHSHQDAVKQVPNGMAGAFLIGEEPVPSGVTVAQQQVMMLNDSGTIGLSINGKSFPAIAPVVAKLGDWVEVHDMNEGQMIHPMHLHGLAQLVIAKGGYPVPQPYDADTIDVGPGERYTVLVHADNPGTWAWHCHILSHAENDQGMFGMVTALVVE
jgi:FtsP/CotA-like multicopper oxidase with cupredoxin domain